MRTYEVGTQELFEYRAGMDIRTLGGVHTRADASLCAGYVDADGVIQYAAANVLRDNHYINGIRHLLLERTATNFMLRATDFSNASWSKTNITITANDATAPDGTLTADRVAATASAATVIHQTSTTITGTSVVFSCFGKKGSGATDCNKFAIHNVTTGLTLLSVAVNWDTGVVTLSSGSGTYGSIYYAKYGYWRVYLAVTGITSGNDIRGYPGFVGGAETAGEWAHLWGAQLEQGVIPTSFIPTEAAVVTRAVDVLYFEHDHVPQEMTVYGKQTNIGNFMVQPALKRYLHIGASNVSTDARFSLSATTGGNVQTQYDDGTTNVVQTRNFPSVPVHGDQIETRQVLTSGWQVITAFSLNGAAESAAAAGGGTGTSAASWAGGVNRLYLCGLSSDDPTSAWQHIRIMSGTQTLSTMQYDYLAATEAVSAEFVHLIEFDFSGGTVRLNTGAHDLSWDGETWEAVGGLLEIGNIEETSDAKGQGVDFKLSGVDQTLLGVLLTNSYRGRSVIVRRAHLNQETGKVVGVHLRFQGLQLSPYTVEEDRSHGGGTVRVSTRISGYFGVDRVRGIQTNLVSHQHHHTGDTFFQHAASLSNKKVYWGTKAPSTAHRRNTSGPGGQPTRGHPMGGG